MIQCIIDGHKAYPLSTSSIKVTYANQYVTDDGEYTYDITFPMDILANREIFHNVSRFEVKKSVGKYDDCKLYCNGLLIMSGVGIILSVTQKEVKLQIVGGKSRIKFNEKMTKHYIDEIDFGEADIPGQRTAPINFYQLDTRKYRKSYNLSNDAKQFLGEQGKWCYMPVRDETNDIIANFVGYDYTGEYNNYKPYITNIAVQPSLMYILRKVIEYEGYKLVRNDFDCSPWNLLYIASAYKTRELRRALPHWSSYTFIEEVRKLFNATISFDEIQKTCKVFKQSEITSADSVEITPLDEYTTDYDDDGSLNISATTNLEYNLGSSSNRENYEVIPKKVFDNFEIKTSMEALGVVSQFADTTRGWSDKQKFTTIIRWQGNYYIYTENVDGKKQWQLAGVWSPLIRDKSSEDYTTLNISPAAQVVENVNFKPPIKNLKNWNEQRCLLSIPNDKESEAKEEKTDDDGYSYVTVQDAIDDDSTLDESEDDQECMNIFFIIPGEVQRAEHPHGSISVVGQHSRWPQFLTDCRINEEFRLSYDTAVDEFPHASLFSLALNPNWFSEACLGQFHDNGLSIDNKNCIEVKFQSDDIPDPSKTFIIQGKKYVCEKIEVEIKDDSIEPIKTGYFYMMS